MRPTLDYVRSRVNYDPETGAISYKSGRGVGGYTTPAGYVKIKIGEQKCLAHRVAWLLQTGEWPAAYVDHKNGVRHDNRWDNLRQATPAESPQNYAKRSGCSSKYLGVCWSKSSKRWLAIIQKDRKKYALGSFVNELEAAQAYVKAKAELHTFQPTLRSELAHPPQDGRKGETA